MLNYSKIARQLLFVQPIPLPSTSVYWPLTEVQMIYVEVLKRGYKVHRITRIGNAISVLLSHADMFFERVLEPNDA